MSTSRCNNHNTVPPSRNVDSKDNGLKFFPCFAFLNLTISSVGTIYRAYTHNDIPMIAFIVFVYFAYFWLDHCFTAINKLPPSDNSSKKKRLQFTVWILSTAILFGFACEFATFLNLPATLSISGISLAISFCLFYSYFIHDNQTNTG
ncbi:hypothetical protein FH972_027165 [Carpinus fangiana]|uniref:Uncharacterized protein n=1 Tax=Carpinus fangiana TaxID=176857 RepID=A0A5N6L6G6_9ROSI|nr:hypothetical protein FH972_027165 [Carpinus fangiana]